MIFLRHLEIFNFLNGLIPRIKRNKFIFFSQSFSKRSKSLPEEHTSSCSGTVCSFASKFQINFMVKLKLAAFYGADHRSNSTCLKGKIPNSWRLSPKESAPLLSHDVSTWLLALCTLNLSPQRYAPSAGRFLSACVVFPTLALYHLYLLKPEKQVPRHSCSASCVFFSPAKTGQLFAPFPLQHWYTYLQESDRWVMCTLLNMSLRVTSVATTTPA